MKKITKNVPQYILKARLYIWDEEEQKYKGEKYYDLSDLKENCLYYGVFHYIIKHDGKLEFFEKSCDSAYFLHIHELFEKFCSYHKALNFLAF